MDILHYLLRMNLCWAIFYAAYQILFRKHTFFTVNRLYLLVSLLAGLYVPMLEVTERIDHSAIERPVTAAHVSLLARNVIDYQGVDWWLIFLGLYLTGVFMMFFLLLKSLIRIALVIRSGTTIRADECRLVLSHDRSVGRGSFSFLSWMVISPDDYAENFESIFGHELVHIKQWHTLDILLVEILKVFFWFNPVLWLYKYSLQEVHEFLADDGALDKDRYTTFMISYARQTLSTRNTSQFFNKSLLKRRIYMIYKERTPGWMGWKYISVFPLLAITVMLMATRRYEYSKPETRTSEADQKVVAPLTTFKYEESLDKGKMNVQLPSGKAGPGRYSTTLFKSAVVDRQNTIDTLPELQALISKLHAAVSNNNLEYADSLKKEINPIIWSESASLRKEQTEMRLRVQGLSAFNDAQNSSHVVDRLGNEVLRTSQERFQARWDYFDKIAKHFDEIASDLRHRLNDVTAKAEKRTQDEIIRDLIAEGVVKSQENLSYRLHNMFLIVNGVEQPEVLHQKLKSRYLKYSWMEWVYNWDGRSGHRFTGVRFNG